MIMGKSEAGLVAVGDVLQVMPNKLRVKVEAVYRDELESFAAKVHSTSSGGPGHRRTAGLHFGSWAPRLAIAQGSRTARFHAPPSPTIPTAATAQGGREPSSAPDGVRGE